jgi:hypothetical protein
MRHRNAIFPSTLSSCSQRLTSSHTTMQERNGTNPAGLQLKLSLSQAFGSTAHPTLAKPTSPGAHTTTKREPNFRQHPNGHQIHLAPRPAFRSDPQPSMEPNTSCLRRAMAAHKTHLENWNCNWNFIVSLYTIEEGSLTQFNVIKINQFFG